VRAGSAASARLRKPETRMADRSVVQIVMA
jgi:hypothetical protein